MISPVFELNIYRKEKNQQHQNTNNCTNLSVNIVYRTMVILTWTEQEQLCQLKDLQRIQIFTVQYIKKWYSSPVNSKSVVNLLHYVLFIFRSGDDHCVSCSLRTHITFGHYFDCLCNSEEMFRSIHCCPTNRVGTPFIQLRTIIIHDLELLKPEFKKKHYA